MTAYVLPFPTRAISARLQQTLQGAMHGYWQCYCGDAVDIECIARLHRMLSAQAVGRREAWHILGQVSAAVTWLEVAHRPSSERASEGEGYVSETSDIYARLSVPTGGL